VTWAIGIAKKGNMKRTKEEKKVSENNISYL
jgi:hypothetical protein